jgi:hypothetical protein
MQTQDWTQVEKKLQLKTLTAQDGKHMRMEQSIRAIAGAFVLISVALGAFYSKYWLLFTAFVGLNLFQSAFTKWCLMEDILAKLGIAEKPGRNAQLTENKGQKSGTNGRT